MDGGNVEYILRRNIQYLIDNLNESESAFFSTEISNWDELILSELADPILLAGNNMFIDKDYLYCLIFTRQTKYETAYYLDENLSRQRLNDIINMAPVPFLKELRSQLLKYFGHAKVIDGLAIDMIAKKIRTIV